MKLELLEEFRQPSRSMRQIFNIVILGALCLGGVAAPITQTSIDASFHFSDTNVTEVRDIELFPDGRIAYGGGGGAKFRPTAGILWPDGRSEWEGNNSGDSLSETRSVAVDAEDGAVFIGGTPGAPFDWAVHRAAFGFDLDWTLKANLYGAATKVLVLPDRDVLAVGMLRVAGDTNDYGLVRLNLGGTRDFEFAYTNTLGLKIENAVVLTDGSVVAAWLRTNGNLVWSEAGRWLRTGERDLAFNAMWAESFGTNSQVTAMEKAPGTNGFVMAVRTEPVGTGGPKFTKLSVFDERGNALGFLPGDSDSYIEGTVHAITFEAVSAATIASGGYDRILVGGEFTKVGETPANNLASLTKEGAVAWAFGTDAGPSGPVYAVEVQLDGKVLIGGAFTNVNGVEARAMARIHGSGAEGATYLYWADEEYRGTERLGATELRLLRGGNLTNWLTVRLSVEALGTGEVLNIQDPVVFSPSQSGAVIPITFKNDLLIEGRERLEITATVTNSDVLITRAYTEVVILDDETPGTVMPHFRYAAESGVGDFAVQADGKIILITGRTNLVRLHPDGSVDSTFITNALPIHDPLWNAQIAQIEIDPAGRIYVSGRFNTTNVQSSGVNHIARLNPDGSLDSRFNPLLRVSTVFSDIVKMDVAPDGGIVFWVSTTMARDPQQLLLKHDARGWWITSYGSRFAIPFRDNGALEHLPNGDLLAYSASMQTIRKVMANGTMDTLALSVPLFSGYIYDMEAHGDQMLLGGSFRQIATHSVSNLTRLNPTTGSIDPNFNTIVNGTVYAVKVHGGKIYISGDFTEVNGQQRIRLARLNGDGSLDEGFDAGLGPNRGGRNLEIQIDGSVILGGAFHRVDGIPRSGLVRLEGDRNAGEIRLVSRRIEASETNQFVTVAVERVGGNAGPLSATLVTVEGSARGGQHFGAGSITVDFADGEIGTKYYVFQIYADPNKTGPKTFSVMLRSFLTTSEITVLLDDAESPLVGGTVFVTGGTNKVRDVAVGADGRVYVAGNFTNIGGLAMTNLARLDVDLSVDASFALAAWPKGNDGLIAPIDAVAVHKNGQLVFSGNFVQIGENDWSLLARVGSDGSYDESFIVSNMSTLGVTAPARELVLQQDEKLIANVTTALRRLNADGTRDASFGNNFYGSITKTVLAPDGTIYLVRNSGGANGSVIKVDSDNLQFQSVITTTYRLPNGATQYARIDSLAIAEDGALLVGGVFTHLNQNVFAPRLAKVSTNGWLIDTNFLPDVGVTGGISRDTVTAIEVMQRGDILIGGTFSEVQGTGQAKLALLKADGKLRTDFQPIVDGTGISEFERAPDGGVVVRGSVSSVNGSPVGDVFKLEFPPASPPMAKFLWPTNGAVVGVSDVEDEIRVHAFDPDGVIERAVLELDGVAVATNSSGNVPFRLFLPASGEHTLRLAVTDESGMTTSETIAFRTVGQGLDVTREGDEVVIQYSGAGLQESTDLADWRNVHSGGGEYRTTAVGDRRFFRSMQ